LEGGVPNYFEKEGKGMRCRYKRVPVMDIEGEDIKMYAEECVKVRGDGGGRRG